MTFFRKTQRGSAILLALWAILLLSALVITWLDFINQEIAATRDANLGVEAKSYAHSGVNVALHPLVTPNTPLLQKSFGTDRNYRVTITGEGGKLNVNWLLRGDNKRLIGILNKYFELRGLSFTERAAFIDCLHDWVDPDNVMRLNGAEDGVDYRPTNQPLQSIDEIREVKGSEPFTSQPGWSDELTLDSGGRVDMQQASLMVLQSLPHIGEPQAQRFIQIRRGSDQKDGTADDKIFRDIQEVNATLGLTEQQAGELNGIITLKDPTYHILSEGQAGNRHRQVEVIARKGGAEPRIVKWKEL